jgi:hypothetical protein
VVEQVESQNQWYFDKFPHVVAWVPAAAALFAFAVGAISLACSQLGIKSL